jgi:hypothetical protein
MWLRAITRTWATSNFTSKRTFATPFAFVVAVREPAGASGSVVAFGSMTATIAPGIGFSSAPTTVTAIGASSLADAESSVGSNGRGGRMAGGVAFGCVGQVVSPSCRGRGTGFSLAGPVDSTAGGVSLVGGSGLASRSQTPTAAAMTATMTIAIRTRGFTEDDPTCSGGRRSRRIQSTT